MLRNYLTIALRSLWRNKIHSLINIGGLALGIACCVLIVLFVKDEWTFDAFHKKADRIYRAFVKEDYGENQQFFNTVTPFPLGPTLESGIPEVEHQVRINAIGTQVRSGEDQYTESVTIAGQHFFDVFDFAVIAGDHRTALNQLNNIVLTVKTAKKYFGEIDPINKVISILINDVYEDFEVKAVVENPPINSSIQFDFLISDLNYSRLYNERVLTSAWFNVTPETYVLLREGIRKDDVEQKFPAVMRTAVGEENYTESKYTVGLQPLLDIHLNTDFPVGNAPVSNPRYSYILAGIALLILIVGCINFVTLAVGRSLRRAKEVGVRKVMGAIRYQLVVQFIGEALIVTLLSLVIGFLLATLALPVFNQLSGKSLFLEADAFILLVAIVLLVIIGLFAGSYPAFVLSNVRPAIILKGSVHGVNSRQTIRKILVGVQLVLSIFLISSTIIMRNQLLFLQNKDLGFNKEQLAVMQLNVTRGRLLERLVTGFEQVELFKNELSKIPDINGVCGASHDFGRGDWTEVGYTDDSGIYRTFKFNPIDPDYLRVLQINLKEGRGYLQDNLADNRRGILINEAMVKELGWTDAVGKRLPGKRFGDHEVIGVVEDFHFASLYSRIEPLVMTVNPEIIFQGIENINIQNSPIPKLFVRLKPGIMMQTIDQIKSTWATVTGGEEFAFSFVDQSLDAQYANEQNLGKIISIATLLAILIGSLGLYGLASLAMQGRIKEISIRKVFGATEHSILVLLSRDYVFLVAISLIVSVPITWLLMKDWLTTFEYRVGIGIDVFLISGGLALLIALATISYQGIKAALTQPAETLKYE